MRRRQTPRDHGAVIRELKLYRNMLRITGPVIVVLGMIALGKSMNHESTVEIVCLFLLPAALLSGFWRLLFKTYRSVYKLELLSAVAAERFPGLKYRPEQGPTKAQFEAARLLEHWPISAFRSEDRVIVQHREVTVSFAEVWVGSWAGGSKVGRNWRFGLFVEAQLPQKRREPLILPSRRQQPAEKHDESLWRALDVLEKAGLGQSPRLSLIDGRLSVFLTTTRNRFEPPLVFGFEEAQIVSEVAAELRRFEAAFTLVDVLLDEG